MNAPQNLVAIYVEGLHKKDVDELKGFAGEAHGHTGRFFPPVWRRLPLVTSVCGSGSMRIPSPPQSTRP